MNLDRLTDDKLVTDARLIATAVKLPDYTDPGYVSTLLHELASRLARKNAALRGLVEIAYDPDENKNDRFERINRMFMFDTGYMMPGKSYPCEAPCDLEDGELQALFGGWVASKNRNALAKARAELSAIEAEGAKP